MEMYECLRCHRPMRRKGYCYPCYEKMQKRNEQRIKKIFKRLAEHQLTPEAP